MTIPTAHEPVPPPVSVSIGHWTDESALTGCTVVLFSERVSAVVDVRGGAPGTRETDLLHVGAQVRAADAILLTGGSAFGLAAADGVVAWLAEHDRGFPTPAGPVPIVPAAVIYDLTIGDATAPNRESGYQACESALPLIQAVHGRSGAGTGATVRKLWGSDLIRRAGLGIATVATTSGAVTAVVVVNAAGAPTSLFGQPDAFTLERALLGLSPDGESIQNTTIGVVIVDADVDHDTLTRCGISAHDGLARSIRPSHTLFDGDLFFAAGLSSGHPEPAVCTQLAVASELAVEAAIAQAVS